MMSVEVLTTRLSELGVHARLEARDRQLVIVPVNSLPHIADPMLRAAVVALARDAGFAHVSLEILPDL